MGLDQKTNLAKKEHLDALTAQFNNPLPVQYGEKTTVPLIRSATDFESDYDTDTVYCYEATEGQSFDNDYNIYRSDRNDKEILWIKKKNVSSDILTSLSVAPLTIINQFYDDYGDMFTVQMTLSPATIESVDENVKSEDVKIEDITSFSSLNNTVWKIESMNVKTMQENQTECEIVDNSLNYNDFTKLKLITDESGIMTWLHFDNADSETYHFDDLTVQFVNPLANKSINIAPMLRVGSNFKFYHGEDGDNNGYFEATQGPSFTNKENEIEQVFRTNDNKLLGIMNVFYIGNKPFMSYMILAPEN